MKVGEMRERLKRLPWKGSVSERVPRVRIPLSPPVKNPLNQVGFLYLVVLRAGRIKAKIWIYG